MTGNVVIITQSKCQEPGCDREPEDVVDGRALCASHTSTALQEADR